MNYICVLLEKKNLLYLRNFSAYFDFFVLIEKERNIHLKVRKIMYYINILLALPVCKISLKK